jgi:hypothetical protein
MVSTLSKEKAKLCLNLYLVPVANFVNIIAGNRENFVTKYHLSPVTIFKRTELVFLTKG